MVAELIAAGVLLLAIGAEALHAARCRRVAMLAFGPRGRPSVWALFAPALRVIAMVALAWSLVTLFTVQAKAHRAEQVEVHKRKHLVILLDVSPSMRLEDSGPKKEQSRMKRASVVMQSFFDRVPIEQYRISVIAFYSGAIPVVIDTTDMDVVNNIFNDLPMHYAFEAGKTDIFSGIQHAADISRTWNPKSAVLVLISDGDTVPATGMPKLPAAVSDVMVVGVGDPQVGKFIDGHQSRQDTSTLRQISVRLGGHFHNANEKHLPTAILDELVQATASSEVEKLSRREYALLASGCGAAILALLPLLLHFFGSWWKPGVPIGRRGIVDTKVAASESKNLSEKNVASRPISV